ncbi:DoxX family protein [Tuwongella immobilis]|uniref:DoxX family protein n=1 Tax=Tuwongella immobilis TaxID=692036 RepID=A0A6C2YIG6_9BACT|nr:DoxX family protein [Tuwongella immobilis]VIP01320.1 DoxX family protein OS=Myxococcus stipitatus (strain DSM 14675 / JCM 12634 / Mx s8) GN=MYSTI_05378 PE=4 SV=1 [Tuwongella immobilis]VTR98066.1 DoxX family protein OS=Myxococcus stipitatus (strain DSM 14675 / JCM 12634 / Mx s8) GN=MYSTI_05378 PE=4 SV=1 [Tuwongella immobilis]
MIRQTGAMRMSTGAKIGLGLMGILYTLAGVNHLLNPDFYMRIMPPYLPWHAELVFWSGIAEMLLGVLVLLPATRRLAAWGIIALLIAVFPANLHMALHTEQYPQVPAWALWLRLPMQGLFIAWAYRYTRADSAAESAAGPGTDAA